MQYNVHSVGNIPSPQHSYVKVMRLINNTHRSRHYCLAGLKTVEFNFLKQCKLHFYGRRKGKRQNKTNNFSKHTELRNR